MRTQSPEISSVHQERAFSRALMVVAGIIGALLAGAGYLWFRHGNAVFLEMIVAGLALCF